MAFGNNAARFIGGFVQSIKQKGLQMKTTLELQRRLIALGYNPGPADGAMGPLTAKAVREFQADHGLVIDGVAGPRSWASLDRASAKAGHGPVTPGPILPPWAEELACRKGLHEERHFSEVQAWLKSAGAAVNPKTTPWCGDAVETAILRTLPGEAMPTNPMVSINWLKFGRGLATPALGAILVFWRGKKSGWQGHVGFYVGEDATHFHVLGGNQSDSISITRIAKNRLREGGIRWPNGFPLPTGGRLVADSNGLMVTENEV